MQSWRAHASPAPVPSQSIPILTQAAASTRPRGWVVDGGLVADQVIANAFTPSQTVTLADAQLALGSILGLGSVSIYLESNVGGMPGTMLTSLTQQGTLAGFPPGSLMEYTCAACPMLQAGTEYWLVAQEPDPDTVVEWAWNDIGDISTGNLSTTTGAVFRGPAKWISVIRAALSRCKEALRRSRAR